MEFRHLGLQLITTIKGFIRDRYRQGAASGVSRSESSGLTVRTLSGYCIIIFLMIVVPPVVSLLLIIGFDESATFRAIFTDEEERQIKLVAVLDVLVSFASSLAREGLALTNERKPKHHTDEQHQAGGKSKHHHAGSAHSADAQNGHANGHSSDAHKSTAAASGADPEHVRVHIPDDDHSSSASSSSHDRPRFDSSGDDENEEKRGSGGGGGLPSAASRVHRHQSANMELADLKQSWVGAHSSSADVDSADAADAEADGMQYVHVAPSLAAGSSSALGPTLGLALGDGEVWVLPRSFKHPWATLARMLCPRKVRRWMLETTDAASGHDAAAASAAASGSASVSVSAAPATCSSRLLRVLGHAWRHYYLSRLIDVAFLVVLCIVANAAVRAHHTEILIRADGVSDADGILVLSPRQSLADSPLLQQYWAEQEYDNLANVIATLSLMRTVYVTTFLHPMTDKSH